MRTFSNPIFRTFQGAWCDTVLSQLRFRSATVRRHLKELDVSKATRPDEIPAGVLKHCAAELSLPAVSIVLPLPSAWHSAILVEDGERCPNPQENVSNSRPKLSPCVPAERPLQSHGESGEQEDHDLLEKRESFV